jgi:hypothetical protein
LHDVTLRPVTCTAHDERRAAEQGHATKDPIEQENRLAERASSLFLDILRDYCGRNDLAPTGVAGRVLTAELADRKSACRIAGAVLALMP